MEEEEKEKGMTRRDFVKTVGAAAAAGSVLSAGKLATVCRLAKRHRNSSIEFPRD